MKQHSSVKNFKLILFFISILLFSLTFSQPIFSFNFERFMNTEISELYSFIDRTVLDDELGFFEVETRNSEGELTSINIYMVGGDLELSRRRRLKEERLNLIRDETSSKNEIKEVYDQVSDGIIRRTDDDKLIKDKSLSFCPDKDQSYLDYKDYLLRYYVDVDSNCDGNFIVKFEDDVDIDENYYSSNITLKISNDTRKNDLKDKFLEIHSNSIYIPENSHDDLGIESSDSTFNNRLIKEYNYDRYFNEEINLLFDYSTFREDKNLGDTFFGTIIFPDNNDEEFIGVYKDDLRDVSAVSYHNSFYYEINDLIEFSEYESDQDDVKVYTINRLFIDAYGGEIDSSFSYLPQYVISQDGSSELIGSFDIYGTVDGDYNDFVDFYRDFYLDYPSSRVSSTLNNMKNLEENIESLEVPIIYEGVLGSMNINEICNDPSFNLPHRCEVSSSFSLLDFIYDLAIEEEICPNLIISIIVTESSGDWKANERLLGGQGSIGMMQISDVYGDDIGLYGNNYDLRLHPTLNIIHGVSYISNRVSNLNNLNEEINLEHKSDYFFGAMGYNLGPSLVGNCASKFYGNLEEKYSCIIKNAYNYYDLNNNMPNEMISNNNELNTIIDQFDSSSSKVYEGGSFGFKVISTYDYISYHIGEFPERDTFNELYSVLI